MWTPEEQEYVAQTVELAVLGATTDPLSEEVLAALRAAIRRYIQSNYHRPAQETLEYQREVMLWILKDIVETPLPSQEDIARLKAQFLELLSWLGNRMREDLDLDDETVEQALAYGKGLWVDDIDQPFYRFDRKPLTREAMDRAQALLEQELETARPEFEKLSETDQPRAFVIAEVRQSAKALVYGALYRVVKQVGNWRVAPVALSQKVRLAGAAQGAASEAWLSFRSLEPLWFILDALLAGGEAAGSSPGIDR